jgi:HEAT repeat protein
MGNAKIARIGRGVGILFGAMLLLASINFATPLHAASSSIKPTMEILLKDGTKITGVFVRFVDGVYVVNVDGKEVSVPQNDAKSIAFKASGKNGKTPRTKPEPKPVARPATSLKPRPRVKPSGKSIAELIKDLYPPGSSRSSSRDADKAVMDQLVLMGADALGPLLELVEKNSSTSNVVGDILKQIEPSVLPQLLSIYRRNPRSAVRFPLSLLLRQGAGKVEPLLMKMLEDSDVNVRRMAMDSLYNIGISPGGTSKAMEKSLFAALGDRDDQVRGRAPAVLARLCANNKTVLPTLINLLKTDRSGMVRYNTVLTLGNMGREAAGGDPDLDKIVSVLCLTLLKDTNSTARTYSAFYLGEMGPKAKAATSALKRATRDKSENVRQAAKKALHDTGATLAASLQESGTNENVSALIAALSAKIRPFGRDREASRARSEARDKLAKLGPKNLNALMIAVRNDKSYRYWNTIARIISGWGRADSGLLTKYTTDGNPLVRRTVAYAWGYMKLGDGFPKNFDKLLHDSDRMVRTSSVDALILWSKQNAPNLQKEIVSRLVVAMGDEGIHYSHRWKLFSRMEALSPEYPEIITAMIKIMTSASSEKTRSGAASSLGSIGRKLPEDRKELAVIVDALCKALRDGDSYVKRRTIYSLGTIGPPARAALPALQRVVKTSDKFLCKQAREAIAKIKTAP